MKSILNGRERFKNKKYSEKACENKKQLKNQRGDIIRMTTRKVIAFSKNQTNLKKQ